MKKVTALIIICIFVLSLFASCGSDEPEFIPIGEEGITHLYWAAGSYKDVDTEEYRTLVAQTYNKTEEAVPYDTGMGSEWTLIAICEADGESSVYSISYVAGDRFMISVSGKAAPDGKDVRYQIHNQELVDLANEKLFEAFPVSVKVDVKFAYSAGTPDADGNVRDAEEVISESTQTVEGDELDLPNAYDAVEQALVLGAADEYKLNSDSHRVTMINGYKEGINESEDGLENLHWRIAVNGEEAAGGSMPPTISDGDKITVTYVLDIPTEQ